MANERGFDRALLMVRKSRPPFHYWDTRRGFGRASSQAADASAAGPDARHNELRIRETVPARLLTVAIQPLALLLLNRTSARREMD